MKPRKQKYHNRLFVQILDPDKIEETYIDKFGRRVYFVKWVEVESINLGSVKNPNGKILQVKWIPKEEQEFDPTTNLVNFFGRFLG